MLESENSSERIDPNLKISQKSKYSKSDLGKDGISGKNNPVLQLIQLRSVSGKHEIRGINNPVLELIQLKSPMRNQVYIDIENLDQRSTEMNQGSSPENIRLKNSPSNQTKTSKKKKSVRELEDLVLKVQNPKFLFGWNLATGYSNFKTWINFLADISALITLWIAIAFMKNNEKKFIAIPIIYLLKWIFLTIDSIYLIKKKVISIFDIIFFLRSIIFWVKP